jgi:uncharacterized protein (TIGR03435 family)
MIRRILAFILSCGFAGATLLAQSMPTQIAGARFDVVSIKANKSGQDAGSQFNPDGSVRIVNMPIAMLMSGAAPVQVVEVKGLPAWTQTENYDILAKPAPDSHTTRAQIPEMLRNLFIDRFKLIAHVEEAERTGYSLVLARSDGRLGPRLMKSTLDCAGVDADRCRRSTPRFTAGSMEAAPMRMDQFAGSIRKLAGGAVTTRTNFDGWYDIKLEYAPTRLDANAPPDDAPQFPTALQEQLGLKLVPEKVKVNVFVVDHIERPTPN